MFVQGLGFSVQGLVVSVWGLGSRVYLARPLEIADRSPLLLLLLLLLLLYSRYRS